MASKEKDPLADLAQNARRQREIAQETLQELRKVDSLLKDPSLDKKTKDALEDIRAGFFKVANDLVQNTVSTTVTVSSTLDVIGELAKHGRD
jgi:uncharacterized membrane protein